MALFQLAPHFSGWDFQNEERERSRTWSTSPFMLLRFAEYVASKSTGCAAKSRTNRSVSTRNPRKQGSTRSAYGTAAQGALLGLCHTRATCCHRNNRNYRKTFCWFHRISPLYQDTTAQTVLTVSELLPFTQILPISRYSLGSSTKPAFILGLTILSQMTFITGSESNPGFSA